MKALLEKYFSAVRRSIPEQPDRSMVGLDIGHKTCKLVELFKNNDRFQVASWAIEPINQGDLKTAVQACLGKLKVPTNAPVTAVFGKGTLIRFIEMPKMSLEDLKQSFSLEADKYFPFPQEQINTDCFILENHNDSKMSVLVAAAKKDLINARMKLLTELGLQVEFIGLNPVAIANVFHALNGESSKSDGADRKEAVAVLDIGDEVSNLTILVNNLPRFSRDVHLGGKELAKSISRGLGCTDEEAQALIVNPGGRQTEVLQACDSVTSNLLSELRLSFDYFATEKNISINQLLVTGGGAQIPGLVEEISKHLDITATLWDPFVDFDISENVNKEELNKTAARLGVALGLALYQHV